MTETEASASATAAVVKRLRAAGCVFAEDEAALLMAEAESPDELDAMVDRRVSGLPLEHILGWAQFCGLRIAVEPGVFVPRHRTEFLAQQAIELATEALVGRTSAGEAPVVVDLCCGAGAIGAATLAQVPGVDVFAADIDPAAVHSARLNIANGQVFEGDLFEALPAHLGGRVAVLVANTPYVPTDAIALMPPEARLHEARLALDGGFDGLDVQRRVAAAASTWLRPGGHVLVEVGEEQALSSAALFESVGMPARIVSSSELYATVVVATRPLIREG